MAGGVTILNLTSFCTVEEGFGIKHAQERKASQAPKTTCNLTVLIWRFLGSFGKKQKGDLSLGIVEIAYIQTSRFFCSHLMCSCVIVLIAFRTSSPKMIMFSISHSYTAHSVRAIPSTQLDIDQKAQLLKWEGLGTFSR
jgi:hypothetical protein